VKEKEEPANKKLQEMGGTGSDRHRHLRMKGISPKSILSQKSHWRMRHERPGNRVSNKKKKNLLLKIVLPDKKAVTPRGTVEQERGTKFRGLGCAVTRRTPTMGVNPYRKNVVAMLHACQKRQNVPSAGSTDRVQKSGSRSCFRSLPRDGGR